ncbi:AMP-binding enzyme family protein [Trichomonas vaginalis G3]|uniref:AMP-binding enzyme family protein n=1 Tax=Trichomonas vaginalis (strain ATCC PRA-98 / G3) TaxID=412133 RepID=A2F809_TRIV3|nr:decanoate-CoA ligase protein [Trichomonas vaginalis G3]EAX98941.1 AMP-binding enzyme family protein [Trichomonas vaginalis G3]KAI5533493.1 decanoate-CoA ligase protein [Trichomonas vaginalis G3]|eukprot:XP_001311871.1 AMP-binding enzyme family protein [Trichomonas vaginalis G3]
MEKDLIESLPQWVEEYDSKPAEIETMQDFFMYTYKKYRTQNQLGIIVDEKIVYKTREEIHQLALRVGSFLLSKGIVPGDRVGVYTENRLESGIFLEACHLFGFVAVFAFDSGIATYPRYTLVDAGVSCIYVSPTKWERVDVLFPPKSDFCPELKFIIVNEIGDRMPYEYYLFDDVIKYDQIAPLPKVQSSDPCTIVYSSGTVGAPKGVVLSNYAMITGIFYIKVSVPVKFGDVHLSFLPMAHILERIGFLIFNYRGAQIVYARQGIATAKDDMKICKITGGPIIPAFLVKVHSAIMEKTEKVKPLMNFCLKLSSFTRYFGFRSRISDSLLFNKIKNDVFGGRLDWFAVAGDVFDAKVHDDLSNIFGAEFVAIYGTSEAAGPLFVCPSNEYTPGTVGRPMPHLQCKFGTKQELLIKTPALFTSYWRNPEITKDAFEDDWYKTGDRAEIEPGTHHLIIPGRAYDNYEYQPGMDLAIPFLRFTYRKYSFIDDIFISPQNDIHALVAIVVVPRNIGEYYFSQVFKDQTFDDEKFKELLKNKDFINYIHYNANKYGKEYDRLKDGSELAAVRLTDEPFTVENEGVTITGKMRVNALKKKFAKEIEEMREEVINKQKQQQQ